MKTSSAAVLCAIALLALASSASAFGFFGHPSAAGHHGRMPGFRHPHLQAPQFRHPGHHHHVPRQPAPPAKRDSVQEFDDRFELYVTPSTDAFGRRFGFDVRYGSGADSVVVTEKRRGGFKQEYRIPESVQKEDISTHYNEANQLVVVFPKQQQLEDQPVASTGAQAELAEEQRQAELEQEQRRQYEEEQRRAEEQAMLERQRRQQEARESMFARKAEQRRLYKQRLQQEAERQRLAREEAGRAQQQAKAAAREEKYQKWKQAQAEKEQKQRVLREFNGKLEELQRAVRQWAEEPEQDSDLVVEDVPTSDDVPKQEDAVSGYYFLGEFVPY